MVQSTTTQLGPNAVAHHAGLESLPQQVPELHHFSAGDTNNVGTNDHADDLTFPDLPPFPNDVPTAPLLRLSLRKLIDQDQQEVDRLWRACCDLGFFYLDLRGGTPSKRDSFREDGDGEINGDGLLQNAEKLFHLGDEVFDLPDEEKLKYDFKDRGSYFGYKGLGSGRWLTLPSSCQT